MTEFMHAAHGAAWGAVAAFIGVDVCYRFNSPLCGVLAWLAVATLAYIDHLRLKGRASGGAK